MTVVEMARVDASMSTFLMVRRLQPARLLRDVLRGCVAWKTGSSCFGCVLLLLNAPRDTCTCCCQVHNSLCMLTIGLLGSEEQKAELLPPLASLHQIGVCTACCTWSHVYSRWCGTQGPSALLQMRLSCPAGAWGLTEPSNGEQPWSVTARLCHIFGPEIARHRVHQCLRPANSNVRCQQLRVELLA